MAVPVVVVVFTVLVRAAGADPGVGVDWIGDIVVDLPVAFGATDLHCSSHVNVPWPHPTGDAFLPSPHWQYLEKRRTMR